MSDVLILIGTMSGTAEMVANEVADQLDDAGFDARLLRMEKAAVATIAAADHVIICTSTYGTGEVPDNGKALIATLQAERPDLTGVSYGIFSLGSARYPNTFCFGGKHFENVFEDLGASRLVERFQHDDRSGIHAADAAADWAAGWIESMQR